MHHHTASKGRTPNSHSFQAGIQELADGSGCTQIPGEGRHPQSEPYTAQYKGKSTLQRVPYPLHSLLCVSPGSNDEPNEVVSRVLINGNAQLAVLLLRPVVSRRLVVGVGLDQLSD